MATMTPHERYVAALLLEREYDNDEIREILGRPPIRRRFLGDDAKAEIVRMWGEGYCIRDIAETLGLSTYSVETYVTHHRDECPKRRRAGSTGRIQIDMDKVVELRERGYTFEQIGHIVGVSKETVRTRVHEMNGWRK